MNRQSYLGLITSRLRRLLRPRPPDPLDQWRRANPTCVIMGSCRLVNATLGRFASLLTGAGLQDVQVGDFSYISYRSDIVNATIGNFCSVGAGVKIGLGRHPSRNFVSTYPAFYTARNTGCARSLRNDSVFDEAVRKTIIEHDVWIASDVLIPGGVTIRTGAIVAAGSVVVKDVPAYAIVGGNPATLIRYRFDEATIRQLLASGWWNWPLERIEANVARFENVREFLASLEADIVQ